MTRSSRRACERARYIGDTPNYLLSVSCRVKKQIDWSWLGAARKYANGKSHRWSDIERSIAAAWGHGSDDIGDEIDTIWRDKARD